MAESKLVFAEERKEMIVQKLSDEDKVHVQELSENFSVSAATIRNDLNELEKAGKLVRTHGGAISTVTSGLELNSEEKKSKNQTNKSRIADKALNYILDGDIVLLDTGTTTLELAKKLNQKKSITVITNDLEIALIIEAYNGINVIVIGGMIRQGFHCTVGMFAHNLLKEVTVDKAFLGTNGMDLEAGLFTPDAGQAETKKSIISCAREAYLLCDSTKIGRKSFAKFADLNDFECIITDSDLDEESFIKISGQVEVIKA